MLKFWDKRKNVGFILTIGDENKNQWVNYTNCINRHPKQLLNLQISPGERRVEVRGSGDRQNSVGGVRECLCTRWRSGAAQSSGAVRLQGTADLEFRHLLQLAHSGLPVTRWVRAESSKHNAKMVATSNRRNRWIKL